MFVRVHRIVCLRRSPLIADKACLWKGRFLHGITACEVSLDPCGWWCTWELNADGSVHNSYDMFAPN
eukprot:1154320-Pelagomonas_calceolata.AAC.5